jgi:hypothetical protein
MPGLGPVDGREGSIVDGQHRLLKPRAPALLALVGSTVVPACAQR